MNTKKMQNSYLITAVLFIVAGIILISWPQTTMKIICYGLGALIFVYGAFQIYTYFNGKDEKTSFQMNLFTGFIACGLGIFMLLKSEIVISILPFIIGFTLLLEAMIKFKHAYDLNQVGYSGYKWIAVLGVITLIFGGLLMYNPFKAATSMVMFIGICLVFDGLSELWTLSCVRKYINAMQENATETETTQAGETETSVGEPATTPAVKDETTPAPAPEMASETGGTTSKFVNITVDEEPAPVKKEETKETDTKETEKKM